MISEIEQFRIFNFDCGNGVMLFTFKKRKLSKRHKMHVDDNIKPGVTIHEPGTKGRVEDLVKFYAENSANEVSAFEV